MGAYHQAAFTLDPNFPIPEETAPAVGVDEVGTGDQIQAASVQHAGEHAIGVAVALTGTYATVTLTADLGEDPYTVHWLWGDGTDETADPGDLVQGHAYPPGGPYEGEFVIGRDGQPSIGGSFPVVFA